MQITATPTRIASHNATNLNARRNGRVRSSSSSSSSGNSDVFSWAPSTLGGGGRDSSQRRRRRRQLQTVAAAASSSDAASGAGTYAQTWSNPNGAVLTPVVDGTMWAAERPFTWNGIDVGGKMGVVRLSDGALWVHSPVELDAPLKAALAQLGEVKHIVSPNFEHVKFAAQWKREYPAATLYGCPGITAAKPDIPYDVEIPINADKACAPCTGNCFTCTESPPEWLGEIQLAFFDCERNPFVGGAFFNEVVFLHAPSRVLMVTDLFWNYPGGEEIPVGTKLWKFGMDQVYLPFYRKAMVGDERAGAYKSAAKRVLGWDFDAMLPCHGSFIARGAKAIMRDYLFYE